MRNGGFVITWASVGQHHAGSSIVARIFDEDGRRIGREFRVDSFNAADQLNPTVVTLLDGTFVIVWESRRGSDQGWVLAQVFNQRGRRKGREFRIDRSDGIERDVAIAPLSHPNTRQNFVAIWRFDGAVRAAICNRQSGSCRILLDAVSSGFEPTVAGLPGSGFVVLWQLYPNRWFEPARERDVFGQAYDELGEKVGDPFPLNDYIWQDQIEAAVVALK